jgi:hypothetical protein
LAKYLSPKDTKANMPNPIANGMATAADTSPPTTSLRMFERQGCDMVVQQRVAAQANQLNV